MKSLFEDTYPYILNLTHDCWELRKLVLDAVQHCWELPNSDFSDDLVGSTPERIKVVTRTG